MKKLSICVAVYNVDKYLSECLNSMKDICADNVEILLTNDCSTDSSLETLRKYEKEYPVFRVIDLKENHGVCYVRNKMIDEACGEFISFVDGDDLLPPFYYSVIESLNTDECDLIFFDYTTFTDSVDFNEKSSSLNGITDADMELFTQRCLTYSSKVPLRTELEALRLSSIWAKIYRRSFLLENGLRFPDNQKKSQDVVFNSYVYGNSPRAAYSAAVMYGYRKNNTSVTQRYNQNIIPIIRSLFDNTERAIEKFYPSDSTITKLYYENKVISEFFNCLKLNIFHRDNPNSIDVKKADFDKLINSEPFSSAFKECNANDFWPQRRVLISCAQNHDFDKLQKYITNPKALDMRCRLDNINNKLKRMFTK